MVGPQDDGMAHGYCGLRRLRGAMGFLEIEDQWGNLWFISERHGIEQYDSELNPTSYNNTNSRLGNDKIRTIFEAVDGKLWFGHNNGATVFEPTPAVITHAGLGTSRIRTMYEDSRGYLWFSISGRVARYDTKTGEVTTASLRLGTVNRDGCGGSSLKL